MSNRITQEKANVIAQEYCLNGLVKAKALIDSGYSESYAKSGRGLKIYDDVLVVQAISRIQQEMKARFNGSVEQSVKDYEQARLLAIKLNQPAAAISAIRWRDGLFGLQTGDKGQEQTVIVIGPKIAENAPVKVENEVKEEGPRLLNPSPTLTDTG